MNIFKAIERPPMARTRIDHAIETLGSVTGVAGASILALNIPESPWGWVLFSVSNIAWIAFAVKNGLRKMLCMYLVYCVIAALGIWRGLIA